MSRHDYEQNHWIRVMSWVEHTHIYFGQGKKPKSKKGKQAQGSGRGQAKEENEHKSHKTTEQKLDHGTLGSQLPTSQHSSKMGKLHVDLHTDTRENSTVPFQVDLRTFPGSGHKDKLGSSDGLS